MANSQIFDIAIIGAGEIGSLTSEFLARSGQIRSIALIDVNSPLAEGIGWRVQLGAAHQGHNVAVRGFGVDLTDIEATKELISALRPKVILHAATLMSVPQMASALRSDVFERIRRDGMAGFLPMHISLASNLQSAIKDIDPIPQVVMASFPDFIIPILSRLGTPPIVGIGNVDNIANDLRCMAAEKLEVSIDRLSPFVVAHHAVVEWFSRTGNADKAPWLAKLFLDGQEVTDKLNMNALISESARRLRAVNRNSRVASSALKSILSIFHNRGQFLHTAGAGHLPGGWPAVLFADRLELVPIPGVSEERALQINLAGQESAGVNAILDDGTLVFTDTCSTMMHDLFGIELSQLTPDQFASKAGEIRRAFDDAVAKTREA